jgi:hypothetical protein
MDSRMNRAHCCLAMQRVHPNESWNKVSSDSSSSSDESRRWRRRRLGLAGSRRSVRCSSAHQRIEEEPLEEHPSAGAKKEGPRSAEAPARLRGGGNNELLNCFLKSDADFMWRNSKFVMPTRLEGGGCQKEINPPATCCETSKVSKAPRDVTRGASPRNYSLGSRALVRGCENPRRKVVALSRVGPRKKHSSYRIILAIIRPTSLFVPCPSTKSLTNKKLAFFPLRI